MDKCPKCGMELKDKHCTYCGYDPNKVVPKKDYKLLLYIIISILTICLSIEGSYLMAKKYSSNQTIKTVKDYSNITIDDTGIAGSVLKVYDSVVVIKTYVNDKLYATGTGFVFEEDDKYGYILTNNHVIEDGNKFKALFTNDEEVDIEVVGADEYSDVAVLKVDKKYVLAVASMGKSEDMLVGDTTFAIGAPVDASTYSWTVTRGIISGKNRIVEVSGTNGSYVMNVLQTDTAINEGNSGGPLCNAKGEVIGVINMKMSSSKVEGIGFAIPIEVALEYANNFIKGEVIIRPYLGITMYDLSNSYFSRTQGIYIRSIENNSPAYKAGLRVGDIITKIGGKEVSSIAYLKYELYKYNIGDEVEITYKRDKEEKVTKVTLGSYEVRG